MNIQIRPMGPDDYDGKGYVHYQSWQETYTGLMDECLLTNQTLEKCQSIARRWPQNTLVAELDGKIVGYGCFIRHDDHSGEVSALYLLKKFQGLGIGRKLMDAMINNLKDCQLVSLWVLSGNDHAIGFYEHYGFKFDGTQKPIRPGSSSIELRMVYHR